MSLHIQNPAPATVPNSQQLAASEPLSPESLSSECVASKQAQTRQISSKVSGNVIFALEEILARLADHLAARLERIGKSVEARTLTMDDLRVVKTALDKIKEDGPPYSAETFNVPVELEYGSAEKGKNLWSVLVDYGIQKKQDTPPKNAQELDALIDKLTSKISALGTISNETLTRLSQLQGNRDNYLSQATEMLMRELKLMLSILNAR